MKNILLYTLIIILSLNPFKIKAQSDLVILSWNIKMLPKICDLVNKNKTIMSNEERLDSIISCFLKSNADIIQLQEAFDNKAVKKIISKLEAKYPYAITPKHQFIKYSNGLLTLSKYPLTLENSIFFNKSRLHDCIVSKGAILYSVTVENQKIFLVNTHLQSDYDLITSEKLRGSQLTQIHTELLDQRILENNPLILAGDFNFNESSSEYLKIKNELLWEDRSKGNNDPMYTFSHLNYWNSDFSSEKLDYIFFKNSDYLNSSCHLIKEYKKGDIDFSDHYPLKLSLSINKIYALTK